MSNVKRPSTALVLSGGGVRGAYEAGVIAGIIEILQPKPNDLPPFGVLAGTSVGAINSAFLAAHSERSDMGIEALMHVWDGLKIEEYMKVTPFGLLRKNPWGEKETYYGRSLLDPRPLDELVMSSIPWDALHDNIAAGRVDALMLAALRISTGRTVVFVEQSPNSDYRPSRDSRRTSKLSLITAAHVLGSAAIPLVFPARRIGNAYYCDGGLRFNTPVAPAIRAGAERIVVISVQHQAKLTQHTPAPFEHNPEEEYPSWSFLAGKILDALLLDPISYDLQVLERFNRLMEVLDENVPAAAMAKVEQVLVENRGMSYQKIKTLVFHPSEDIGVMAGAYVRQNIKLWKIGLFGKWLLGRTRNTGAEREADWASYLLFDGGFTKQLIELGRQDALAQADTVRAFFA
jgi:NTE family protein